MNTVIFKGDDTSAFGTTFISIEADIPEGYVVSKAKVKVTNLPDFIYENPTFPIEVNLTSAQTRALSTQNEAYLIVYDEWGRKKTCQGVLRFIAKDEVD